MRLTDAALSSPYDEYSGFSNENRNHEVEMATVDQDRPEVRQYPSTISTTPERSRGCRILSSPLSCAGSDPNLSTEANITPLAGFTIFGIKHMPVTGKSKVRVVRR